MKKEEELDTSIDAVSEGDADEDKDYVFSYRSRSIIY